MIFGIIMRKLFFTLFVASAALLSCGFALAQQATPPAPSSLQQIQQLLAQSRTGATAAPAVSSQIMNQPATPATSQQSYLPAQIQQAIQQGQVTLPTANAQQPNAMVQSLLQQGAAQGVPAGPTQPTAAQAEAAAKIQSIPTIGIGGIPTLGATLQATQGGAAPAQQQQATTGPTMYDKAFDSAVNQMVPLTPDQITKLHEVFDATQYALTTQPGVPAKPTTSSIIVNLSPKATPPVIRLSAGYITSLVFMDSTGQPWPIDSYSIGNPGAFNIQWDKKGNTLLMQAQSFYKTSNLAVILKDLNTPVMITLLTGQGAVDYRVDIRVPGFGPNAMFIQNGLPDSANPILLDILNGIPPKGSKALKISGGVCEAWILNNKLYLRTTLDVISPAWQAVMSSIDGTHAYELQPAPVILALQHGKDRVLSLSVEGLE